MAEKLFDVVARAATPRERFVGTCFQPLHSLPRRRLEEREEAWIHAVTAGDRQAFAKLLKDRGMDWNQFQAHLHDVSVRNGCPLPGWGQVLLELLDPRVSKGVQLDSLHVRVIENHSMEWPYYSVFHPFLQGGLRFLTGLVQSYRVPVTPGAMAGMLTCLARRLEMVSIQVVMNECSAGVDMTGYTDDQPPLQLYETLLARGGSLVGNWLDLFDAYPVLGRVMGVAFLHWRSFIDEFLGRLGTDLGLLNRYFTRRSSLGALEDFEIEPRGLTYNGGRAVTFVGFASGQRVVYKPKDLRILASSMTLTRLLNKERLHLSLHTRTVIAREGYAWEEYISPSPCTSPSATRRFYFRMGMLLRFLQVLQARDIGAPNIIACGEYPAVIDLETLFYPSAHAGGEGTARRHVAAFLEESPLEVGMLPFKAWAQVSTGAPPVLTAFGASAYPMSATLNRALERASFGVTEYLRAVVRHRWSPDSPQLIDYRNVRASWKPVLGDQVIGVTDHVSALLAGFRRMAQELQSAHEKLDEEEGLLSRMAEHPARYIYRTTWLYGRLLLESLLPVRLRDGVMREISLERLWKAYLVAPLSVKIVEQELEAIRQLDIPAFHFVPCRDIVIGPDGTEIEGVLRGSSLEEVLDRVRRIRDRSPEKDLDVVRSALSCIADTTRDAVTRRSPSRHRSLPCRECPADDQWLDQAVRIGEFILAEAIEGRDGGLGWAGLCVHPWTGARCIEPLPPDLLSGSCGMALLFADLYRLSGRSTFERALDRTLIDLRREVFEWPSRAAATLRRDPAKAHRQIYCGAFYGLGAAIYTLLRCARLPKYRGLVQAVSRCIQSVPADVLERCSSPDIISGRAGLLISLLSVDGIESEPEWSALVGRLAQALLTLRRQQGGGTGSFPAAGRRLVPGLPGAELGIDLALLRWSRRQETQEAEGLLEEVTEKILRDSESADRPSPDSGRLLVGLAACQVGGELQDALLSAVRRELEADPSVLSSSLLLEVTELAVTGLQVTQATWFRERAWAYAEELVRRQKNLGTWFPESLAADRHNLSAITGVTAIGHTLLKLQSPREVSSIRLLE